MLSVDIQPASSLARVALRITEKQQFLLALPQIDEQGPRQGFVPANSQLSAIPDAYLAIRLLPGGWSTRRNVAPMGGLLPQTGRSRVVGTLGEHLMPTVLLLPPRCHSGIFPK